MRTSALLALSLILTAIIALPVQGEEIGFSLSEGVETAELSSGSPLLVRHNPATDLTAVVIFSTVGAAHDPEGMSGLTNLTLRTMQRGAGDMDALAFADRLESQGMDMEAIVHNSYSGLLLQGTSAQIEEGLDLLQTVLFEPQFLEEERQHEAEQAQHTLDSMEDEPSNQTLIKLMDGLFGEHPYGRLPAGTEEGINQAAAADMTSWARYIFHPEHTAVAVVGPVAMDEMQPAVDETLGSIDWEKDPVYAPTDPGLPDYQGPETITHERITQAAWVGVGFPGPASHDPKRAPGHILEAAIQRRLFRTLRDEYGLVYITQTAVQPDLRGGHFWSLAAAAPGQEEEVAQRTIAGFRHYAEEPMEEDELETMRSRALGRELMNLETTSSQALSLAAGEVLHGGYDWRDRLQEDLRTVTAEDIQETAKEFFTDPVEVFITP